MERDTVRTRHKNKKQTSSFTQRPTFWDIAKSVLKERHLDALRSISTSTINSILGRGLTQQSVTDEFGIDPGFMEVLRPFFEFLYHLYFRVDIKGAHNVPHKGPAILVANHSGALPYDGIMIHLAIYNEHTKHRIVRFLVEDFVFEVPLLNSFIRKAGGVRACHENATTLIKRNQLIVVFPEGTKGVGKSYDQRYQLQRFGHGGFIRLAMRTGAAIVPVAVIGAEEIHPIIWKSQTLAKPLGIPFVPFTPTFPWLGPLGLVPLPSKWKIVFGKLVPFKQFRPTDAENEVLVEKQANKIRNTVQRMIDIEIAKRKSIWV